MMRPSDLTLYRNLFLPCFPCLPWFKTLAPTTPETFVPTLDQLKRGERGRIVEIAGDDGIAVRLMEMGLTEGEDIEVLGFAPLGDPIEFRVRGYHLSLRASEARRVVIAD